MFCEVPRTQKARNEEHKNSIVKKKGKRGPNIGINVCKEKGTAVVKAFVFGNRREHKT